MKKYLVWVVLVFLFIAACRKQAAVGGDLVVEKGSCVQTNSAGGNIRICYEELVEESRCPANMMCIWSGYAVVRLSATIGLKKHTVLLSTIPIVHGASSDTTIHGVTIHLQEVRPYPGASNQPVPSVVVRVGRN